VGSHKKEILPSRISDRDANEFERMFRLYFLRLAKFAYKYVGNASIAQDLTQSVFLNIWELNGEWNPPGTVKSYLYSAVKNQCLNHIKHKKIVEDWKTEEAIEPKWSQMKMDWESSDREMRLQEVINIAINKMPNKRREVFELSRNEGLTHSEISDVLGITKKTVENHMGNALLFLKDELKEWI
tara:strand:- start:207 stop:758 length:552 start_codon:yes stop_codon:yes gene_type:complete